MPFDEEAATAEVIAYKAAIAAFEQTLRAKLPGDLAARLAGYKMRHSTTWIGDDGRATQVDITIVFVDISGI